MMIQGCDILLHYPNSTGNDLLEWCKAGRLKPFRKCDGNPFGKDPKSPRGWRRVFPPGEPERRYNQLCGKYLSLIDLLKSARLPDTNHIKTDRDAFAAGLSKSASSTEPPGIEVFKYNLHRRRQREAAEIFRLFSEIEDLEKELEPGKVWGDPRPVSPEIIELLMSSFFRSEDDWTALPS